MPFPGCNFRSLDLTRPGLDREGSITVAVNLSPTRLSFAGAEKAGVVAVAVKMLTAVTAINARKNMDLAPYILSKLGLNCVDG
jgi:hypothetical protein